MEVTFEFVSETGLTVWEETRHLDMLPRKDDIISVDLGHTYGTYRVDSVVWSFDRRATRARVTAIQF